MIALLSIFGGWAGLLVLMQLVPDEKKLRALLAWLLVFVAGAAMIAGGIPKVQDRFYSMGKMVGYAQCRNDVDKIVNDMLQ